MDLPENEAEWQRVLHLSSTHLVTPLLRRSFQEHGLVSGLPADVLEFLDAVCALNLERNLRYEDQLAHLIQVLNNTGVRPVLLKGAATFVSGLYPTPGERMIGDIDVLIPPSKLAGAVEHLIAAGYMPVAAEEKLPDTADNGLKFHHYPRIYSLDWPAPVELHVHPVHLPAARLLGSEEVVRDATPLNWRGGDCLLPSPTHFVMHNVIHAFVVDSRDRGILSLRQLFEFVYAVRTYGERIDWAVIQQRFDSLGYRSALRGYVVVANAYMGFQVPPALIISGWTRLRCRFYRFQPETPATHFLFSLGRLLRIRARNLGNNPRNMKKLLSVRFYIRLYKAVLDAYLQFTNK
ncbi:MAG: nucleotidyltransferase domain-containing protein [Methylocella sp.]